MYGGRSEVPLRTSASEIDRRFYKSKEKIASACQKAHIGIDEQVLDQEEEEREEAWKPVVRSFPSPIKAKPNKAAKKLPQRSSSSFWCSCSGLASDMGNTVDDTETRDETIMARQVSVVKDTKIAKSSLTGLATELSQPFENKNRPESGATYPKNAEKSLVSRVTGLSLTLDDTSGLVVQKQPAGEVTDTNSDAISSDDTSGPVLQKQLLPGVTDTSNDEISNEELIPEESRHIDGHGELATEQPKVSGASTSPASEELSSSPFWTFWSKLACGGGSLFDDADKATLISAKDTESAEISSPGSAADGHRSFDDLRGPATKQAPAKASTTYVNEQLPTSEEPAAGYTNEQPPDLEKSAVTPTNEQPSESGKLSMTSAPEVEELTSSCAIEQSSTPKGSTTAPAPASERSASPATENKPPPPAEAEETPQSSLVTVPGLARENSTTAHDFASEKICESVRAEGKPADKSGASKPSFWSRLVLLASEVSNTFDGNE